MLSCADLVSGFGQTGIKDGDAILVHSSYKSLGGVEGGAGGLLQAFLDLVGPEGTALFPTFNFQSWTEAHYFDIRETPSKMGILSELARAYPGVVRTPHPIYSFAALGRRKQEFAACDDSEAFGEGSVFGLLHRVNALLVSIGLDFNNTFTIVHYVERRTGCDYRRFKQFSGIYVGTDGVPQIKTYSMFVRKDQRVETYVNPATDELLANGVIGEVQVGEAKVHYVRAAQYVLAMSEIVRTHPEKMHRIAASSF
jgi:aminoglycoside 3-N-acetyltransferase